MSGEPRNPGAHFMEVLGPDGKVTRVFVGPSAGSDGAMVVIVDTEYEPDGSDGGTGLRVLVNDGDAFVGVPYEEVADEGGEG